MLLNVEPNTLTTPSKQREGVDIQFSAAELSVSPRWQMDGWQLQFARLPAGTMLDIDHTQGRVFIKVVTGELNTPVLTPFTSPREVRSTQVTEQRIQSSSAGAMIAVFTETPAVPANVHTMAQLAISGSCESAFEWRSFGGRYGEFIEHFVGLDAYMSGGFHLLNETGAEISYVNLWTAGKGVNLTTHNHGGAPNNLAPAFAEVHWVFNNGTQRGGMYSADAQDGPKTQTYALQRGDEHGPFFEYDRVTGRPSLSDNGAVKYPWHGWEAGNDDKPEQAYDVVAAFETNPQFVTGLT